MPTNERWLQDDIILVVWEAPLTREDVDRSINQIANWIKSNPTVTHVLADITRAGKIPNSAPLSAIRSKFMTKPNTGRIAVIGMDKESQVLTQVAVSVTRKEVRFFPDEESAMAYLREADATQS